ADDARFLDTPVYLDGRAVNDAALLLLLAPSGKFGLLKTQGLDISSTVFTVTKADETNRVVREFDGRPAAKVYAEAIGMEPDALSLENTGSLWPLALMVGDEPFLRVAAGGTPDGGLQFLHSVGEGMRLKLSRTTDIVESTALALAAKRKELGGISGILHFNCLSRQNILEAEGKADEFGRLFRGFPHAGLASHGEIYIAVANYTSTMLLFA
ncbi:MAG: FIST C-terminal domain-containing protein, partial [Planctomycetota bacterium]|nr:FIST C-terminal domain-containing protein [Planctomycetota bacterium]